MRHMNRAITHRAAVLGSPIGHSRSPLLHNTGYRAAGLEHWSYGRFECIAEHCQNSSMPWITATGVSL